jgi:hypothetical protein
MSSGVPGSDEAQFQTTYSIVRIGSIASEDAAFNLQSAICNLQWHIGMRALDRSPPSRYPVAASG